MRTGVSRTLAIASAAALVAMTIVAWAGGTVITGPTAVPNNSITDAKLRDSSALSVIGRASNSVGDPADIAAASDGDVLRRSGTALGFGAIPESSVTGLTSDLSGKVPTTRTLTAGTGLSGGGDLSSDRTFTVNITGASCSAGAFLSTLGATGTGSCTTAIGTSSANTIAKYSGANAIAGSLLTDNGTTFAINTNKFTVTEASGNTTIAGTLNVNGGITTLTGTDGASGLTAATPSQLIIDNNTLRAQISLLSNSLKRISFGNSTAATDGFIDYDGGAARTMRLSAGSATQLTLDASGVTVANTLVASGNTNLSLMTSGSVLFAGTAGLVSQDNTAFNWNNSTKTMTITSPSGTAIGALSNSSSAGTMYIENTNSSGPSDFYATNNSGTAEISFGYGNASYSDSARAGKGYVWRNTSINLVFARTGVTDATLFSNGNFNIGSSTSDPGVKLKVEGDISNTGAVTLGDATTDRHTSNGGFDAYETTGSTFPGLDSTTNSNLAVWDTTGQTTGVGGGILFLGKYTNSGNYAGAGGIKLMKTNSTDNNYSFDLVLGTRANGANLAEVLRLFSTGAANFVGDLSVATNKFTVTSSNGNTSAAGTLSCTSDFAVNTNKFTVTASSGNTLVAGTLSVNGNPTLGDANADLSTVFGHVLYNGTAPSKSAGCDGSGTATVTGTDAAFHSTTGTGATACTWTFSRTYTVAPTCTVFVEGGGANPTCTISATAITCTVAAASTVYHWMCATSSGGA